MQSTIRSEELPLDLDIDSIGDHSVRIELWSQSRPSFQYVHQPSASLEPSEQCGDYQLVHNCDRGLHLPLLHHQIWLFIDLLLPKSDLSAGFHLLQLFHGRNPWQKQIADPEGVLLSRKSGVSASQEQ